MAIIWAARSDNAQYSARFSTVSTSSAQYGAGVISYDVDATALGGFNWNLDQGAAANRQLSWNFQGVHTTAAFSVLMRVKNAADALLGYWKMGCYTDRNSYQVYQNASAYQLLMFNDAGTTIRNASTTVDPSVNQWDDMVVTWDGTTGANALKFYINNVVVNATASAAAGTVNHQAISIGTITSGVPNARYLFNEMVVWNEVIDPGTVTLTTGSGALDGPTRTAFVNVALYNGATANAGGGGVIHTRHAHIY